MQLPVIISSSRSELLSRTVLQYGYTWRDWFNAVQTITFVIGITSRKRKVSPSHTQGRILKEEKVVNH